MSIKWEGIDISGMGGSYEIGCQYMVYIGVKEIEGKPFEVWNDTHTYENIFGIVSGTMVKHLEKLWEKNKLLKDEGLTGAMVQAAISHIAYIHKNGLDKWRQLRKSTIYELPETDEEIEKVKDLPPDFGDEDE